MSARSAAEIGLIFEEPPAPRPPRPRKRSRTPRVVTPPDHIAGESHRPHGSYVKYVVERCRCEPCRQANREYERRRVHAMSRPDEVWAPYVPAGRARRHLEELAVAGVGLKTVAKMSGVPHGSLSKLVYGERGKPPSRRIRPETARRILAVKATDAADGQRVDGARTIALLDELVARGFTKTFLATELAGRPRPSLQLARRRDGQVRASTARKVEELYRRLDGVEPPPRRSRWENR